MMAAFLNQLGRPEEPVLRRKGFTLGADLKFGATGLDERLSSAQLLELYFPDRLEPGWKRQAAKQEASKSFDSKPFVHGHLRWYGIPFKATGTQLWDLVDLLRESALANKCDEVHPTVLKLEQSMRKDYAKIRSAWLIKVSDWEAEQQRQQDKERRRKDEAWNNCKTPGARAAHDLDRFMEHYFLTNGEPDPSKTTEAIALHGFSDRATLHERAGRIPGLETVSGGVGYHNRVLCIGWNRSDVFALARSIDAQAREAERKEVDKEVESKWQDAMKDHQALVKATKKDGGPKTVLLSPEPANLQKSKGSYVIQCDQVRDEWDSRHLFTLDISRAGAPRIPKILAGALQLSWFEGTMLVSLEENRGFLDDFVSQADDEDKYDDDDDDDDDEDDDEDDDKEEEEVGSSKKRKAPTTKPRGRPKKQKLSGQRFAIAMRGRDTGTGEIQTGPYLGYLEFTDKFFTHFKGKVDLPAVSGDVEFEGFKVSAVANQRAEPWENFSPAAYEYANKARWL
ncbi:hypothetical protein QBC47DRAFT_390000 [Echria macrotheca]|uniref:Uncharacterized protein n=1 Tax=Echria macrotheca TaxID=438768 RepID=A0AAJ0F6C2_9PEZI|nr:hypothetical protein QBC47DRAFT_390000 [Echria macrotheca]